MDASRSRLMGLQLLNDAAARSGYLLRKPSYLTPFASPSADNGLASNLCFQRLWLDKASCKTLYSEPRSPFAKLLKPCGHRSCLPGETGCIGFQAGEHRRTRALTQRRQMPSSWAASVIDSVFFPDILPNFGISHHEPAFSRFESGFSRFFGRFLCLRRGFQGADGSIR